MVHVRLLARTDAPVHLADDLSTEQLEEDHASARIHHLFRRGTIRLVPHFLSDNKTNQVGSPQWGRTRLRDSLTNCRWSGVEW